MRRRSSTSALVVSAALSVIGLGAAGARAQNIVINDSFDDGNLATNTNGVGAGWTATSNGYALGTETGNAFHSDTSGGFDYALQAISSNNGFDFWNSGGATINFTTHSAAVTHDQSGTLAQFPGGQQADWRQELGLFSFRRSPTDNADDELYLNHSGGLYIDLFYDQNGGPSGTNLKVTGNVRAVNKFHTTNSDTEGSPGLETLATFTLNGYDGQSNLLSTLHVNNTGFSLGFDKSVSWQVSPLVGASIVGTDDGTLVGNFTDMNDASFTDEFVNPYGPDAYISAMGQNMGPGRGSGDLSNVTVNAAQLSETPPAADTFWNVTTGDWNVAGNWTAGIPTQVNNAVIDNNGTVNVHQSGLFANLVDIGSDRGLTAPTDDATGRGGTLNIQDGANLTVYDAVRVGQAHNATGTLNVTGGTLTVAPGGDLGDIYIGDNGNGTFNMSGGTVSIADELFLGIQAGSTDTMTISGGTLSTDVANGPNGNFLVGFAGANTDLGFPAADATLNISGSAVINTHFLFSSFSAGSTSTITMTGGTINSHGAVVFGRVGQSTINHSGGAINIPDGNGDFVVGDAGICTYNISGTASVNAENNFIVSTFAGGKGVVKMTCGSITASQYRIGASDLGIFNQSAGTVHAQPGAIFNGSMFLGDFDHSHGQYTISGGTLTIDGNLNVGAALASNAPPDAVRIEPSPTDGAQGQALDANGVFTVSGSGSTINVGGKLLADPADKSAFRSGPGNDNSATLNFQIFDNSGTSLVNVGGAADIDGAVVNVDLMNGFTPAAGKVFKLVTAASFGATGTGTTQNVGTGVGAKQDAGDVGNFSVAVLPDGGKQSLEASAGILPVGALVGPQAAVIGGTVQIQSGSAVSKLGNLIVNTGGKLDLTNNKLIVTAPNSTGTWNGTAYDGISGLVQSARGNGSWNGTTGITSSSAATNANPKLYSIGVVKVTDLKGGTFTDSDTTTFAGQTVSGSDTIAMFTYAGDANLDGKINIDDYGLIDSHVGQSGTAFGWHNGDFNYDGKINIDDYGIIDGNIGAQGAPIPTALLAGGAVTLDGVSAVPEPGSLGLIAVIGAGMLGRRRRNRRESM
jgi:hypothetical protein